MLDKLKAAATFLSGFAIDKVLPAVTILVIGILAIRIILKVLDRFLEKSRLEKAAYSLIKSLANVILYLLLGLIVASSLGIDVSSIVALASVLTLAVSLAVQDLLTNVLGGFTLLYTQPFHSGDYVDVAGQSGTVKEIGLTYTKLTTPDNKEVSIPNSAVTAAQIVNYSSTGTRRVEIKISASYNTPLQKVVDALLQAGTVDNVLLEPAPMAAVDSYGESAVNYVLRVWTKTDDYWDVYYTIIQKIKTVFDETGIEMTYPHLNVHIDK